MPLQIFGFPGFPHDIGVTKIDDATPPDCVFFLDFNRPLQKVKKSGALFNWLGPSVGLLVPVVHQGERSGGYVISVVRGDPYFATFEGLWKLHTGSAREMVTSPVDELEIVADFARHFFGDAQVPAISRPR